VSAEKPDCWAQWLAERRYGGDEEVRESFAEKLGKRRERVLENAQLVTGETLLDVGCGEGLIAFGALEHGAGQTIFSDISTDLLDMCRRRAGELGVLDRCRFVEAPAHDLTSISDESVDVVTTRSVLVYVRDKRSAFREFHRVLRAGGRISLYEPINRFAHPEPDGFFGGYDLRPLAQIAAKLNAVYDAIQPPESDPMLDFDERDLLRLAEESGFSPIGLHFEAEVRPSDPTAWETFRNQAGNPRIPTLAEAMADVLSAEEQELLTRHLQPLVEAGQGTWRMGHAYLFATKPRA
jgi:ubiquinone/menaquinone biosynthesis C-methylase UbiE